MKPAIASATARSSNIIGEIAGIVATGTTVMLDVLELFPAPGSGLVVDTTAVFASGPGADGSVTVSAIDAEPRFAMEPSEQVMVVVPLQLPCVGVAETKVVPAGIASVTVTFAAAVGPALLTAIA
jgi:hypothetical protein